MVIYLMRVVSVCQMCSLKESADTFRRVEIVSSTLGIGYMFRGFCPVKVDCIQRGNLIFVRGLVKFLLALA